MREIGFVGVDGVGCVNGKIPKVRSVGAGAGVAVLDEYNNIIEKTASINKTRYCLSCGLL